MFRFSLRAAVSAPALALAALASPAFAQEVSVSVAPLADADAPADQRAGDLVIVTGKAANEQVASTAETRSAEQIEETTSIINAEDSLRYFPNILVRKRHIGDTQAPITTRTSGVGASARSLVYADGVLLSALIGNNNSNASPKWGMVSPEEIASVSVLYGPFSAAYAGNSIGAVVEIETRMPDRFEAMADIGVSLQDFSQYYTSGNYGAQQGSLVLGNRYGPASFWISGSYTDSDSQPLSYVTATRPASLNAAGVVTDGAIATFNRAGLPIVVLGAGGFESQEQTNLKFKTEWDISDQAQISWSIGRFGNDTVSGAQTYLRNSSGAAWSGPLNINGYSYNVAASAFSNSIYKFEEEQWSNSASFDWTPSETFEARFVVTSYDYGTSEQRTPSAAIPAALSGGAGSIARMDGTGWKTIDADGIWRPQGREGAHEVSFGVHGDRYELQNDRFATTNWLSGGIGALQTSARGKTQTTALWAQDAWAITDQLTLIAGGRWEKWEANDGFNYSLTTPTTAPIFQPGVEADAFSPKASLTWNFSQDWSAKASIGKAYRFPTVGELYQLVTVGTTVTSPNPNLKPEEALSTEFSLTRHFEDGQVRVSVFTEDLQDALISQTAQLPASTVVATFIQNIDKVESRGIEVVADKDDVLIDGLSLSGSLTYVDSTTAENPKNTASVGKQTAQVPEWRATLVGTYRPNDVLSFTLAGRYVDRVYGTIDNSDSFSHTYQGFEAFMTWDVRATFKFNEHWSASAGIENLFDADYFLFHPFPQRTFTGELQYRF